MESDDDDDDDDDGAVIMMIIAAAMTVTTTTTTTTTTANTLHMLNVKIEVMQGIIGQTGTVSKLFRKCLTQHTWKARHQVVMEHILKKLLILKFKMFFMGNNIICVRYCSHRITSTSYTLET